MLGKNGEIAALIDKYSDKHPLAKECGSEYIYQDDEAQEDAIKLTGDIFDMLAKEHKTKNG